MISRANTHIKMFLNLGCLLPCNATREHFEYCLEIVSMIACWVSFSIKSLMNLINSDLEVDYGSEEKARIIYTSLAVDTEVNFVVVLLVGRRHKLMGF